MASAAPVPVPIAARAAMINGSFQLSSEQTAFMALVRQSMAEAAEKIVRGLPPQGSYDTGRVIAGLDTMQQAKDVLCAAAILPAYKP